MTSEKKLSEAERSPVNSVAVHSLLDQFGTIVKQHFDSDAPIKDRGRVCEVLNALASVTALVISGTGSPDAEPWFQAALRQELDDLAAHSNGAALGGRDE